MSKVSDEQKVELSRLGSTRFAVFASGRGSNFEAVYRDMEAGKIDGEIACLISNNRSAPARERAEGFGIPSYHKTDSQFGSESDYVRDVTGLLEKHQIDYILLAGYMKKIPASLLDAFPGRIVNIHPALLPSFGGKGYYGKRVHEAVIERGVKWTGVTVHFVDEIYDHGPIIYQYPIRVHEEDTPESLGQRVLQYEHKAYPRVVRWLSKGWISVDGMKTYYSGPEEEWEISIT